MRSISLALALSLLLLRGSVGQGPITTVLVEPQTINRGSFGPSAPVTIAAAATPRTLTIQFTSDDWLTGEAGLVVDYILEASTDGGQSWGLADAASARGGAVSSRTGALPSSWIAIPPNVTLMVRGSVTVSQRANSLGLTMVVR